MELTTLANSVAIHLARTTAIQETMPIQAAVGTRLFGNTLAKNGSRMISASTGGTFSINSWSSEKYSAAAEIRRSSTESSSSAVSATAETPPWRLGVIAADKEEFRASKRARSSRTSGMVYVDRVNSVGCYLSKSLKVSSGQNKMLNL